MEKFAFGRSRPEGAPNSEAGVNVRRTRGVLGPSTKVVVGFFLWMLAGVLKSVVGVTRRPRVYICCLNVLYAVTIPLSGSVTLTDKYTRASRRFAKKRWYDPFVLLLSLPSGYITVTYAYKVVSLLFIRDYLLP